MLFNPALLDDIRKTIDSGYYERLTPVRRERKSVCECLEQELEEGRLPLILEVATAWPEKGLLLPNRTETAALIDRLALLAPAAMSMWVEPRHMAGDLRWLAQEREFPVICKDFVIDCRQVVGGDALLLKRPLLKLAGADEHALVDAAHDLDMEVIMEVRTSEELNAAKSGEADIIAISNSCAGGNGHAASGQAIRSAGVPDITISLQMLGANHTNRPVISTMGIRTPAHVRALISAGAAGVELDAQATVGPQAVELIDELKKAMNGKEPPRKESAKEPKSAKSS